MTKKPLNPLEDPPTASSSEEDELETSEEEVSSSEDDESKDPIKKIPSDSVTVTAPVKSTAVSSSVTAGDKQGSDSDSGSETETDSDSETERPNSGSVKPIAVSAVKKKEDPPSSATLALPAVKSVTKRAASEATTSNSTKRAKKVTSVAASGEEESIKKPAFQRLWSEEDEIAVLQGIIDFKGDTGKSFIDDTNGFYDFVKKSISFDVSKNQFMDKIRSLKKKYMGKEVKNGVEPSFLKAHDKKAYELSKFIWGPDGIVIESNGVTKKSQSKTSKKKLDSVKQELLFGGGASLNGKQVEDVDDDGGSDMRKSDWFDKSFLVGAIAGFGVGEFSVKEKWSLLSVESKKMIEDKLRLLQDQEYEFVLEKTDFLHEVTSMIAEASKKNKSLDI